MRKLWLAPCLAALMGLLGGFLRYLQLKNGFEDGFAQGLAKRGAPETLALALLSLGVALAALVFAVLVSRKLQAGEGFTKTFGLESLPALLASGVFAAAVLMGSAVFAMRRWGQLAPNVPGGGWDIALLIFLVFLVGTGVSLLVMAISYFTRREGSGLLLASVVPAVFFCYWLVMLYRDNLGNPVMLDYCFGCLAFAFSALSFYYMAGFAFGRRKTGCAVFFQLAAIYFLCLTMADMPSRSFQTTPAAPSYSASLWLVLGGTAGFLFMSSLSLLQKLSPRERPEAPKASTKEEGSGE